MVDLGEDRQVAAGEALDEVGLPQRAVAIERCRRQVGDQLGQFLLVARRGHRQVADVEARIEVGVVDPIGIVELERDLDQPPARQRDLVHPLFEDRPQLGNRHP